MCKSFFSAVKMNETNPLRINQASPCSSKVNKRGRPTNENIIKFGPQPKSLVSQVIKQIKEGNVDLAISLDAINKTRDKGNEFENCDAHYSSIQIDSDAKIMNSAKDTRKFPCDFPNCKYACKLSSNLIKHKRTHTSEKPFLCHLCSFRSNFINSLKVHERIHTAERPFACNYCEYRCNSSSNLKKHCKHRHKSHK